MPPRGCAPNACAACLLFFVGIVSLVYREGTVHLLQCRHARYGFPVPHYVLGVSKPHHFDTGKVVTIRQDRRGVGVSIAPQQPERTKNVGAQGIDADALYHLTITSLSYIVRTIIGRKTKSY